MYTESSLYVGTEDSAIDFIDRLDAYASSEAGWMQATLARLVDPGTVPGYDPSLPGPVGIRDIVVGLAAEGLTHAVLVSQHACDDETDAEAELAEMSGMSVVVEPGEEDIEMPVGRHVHLRDEFAVIASLPFRLSAWTPVRTVHGGNR